CGHAGILGAKGKDEAEHGAGGMTLGPDASSVLLQDHTANREAQPTAGAILAARISGIFLEDFADVNRRNTGTGIVDIDPERIGRWDLPLPAVHGGVEPGGVANSSLPEIGVAANVDGAVPGGELAGVVQEVDEGLFDPALVEEQAGGRRLDFDGYGNTFVFEQDSNLMQRLIDTLAQV